MRIRVRQTFFFYICVILEWRVYSQGNFVFDSTNVQINALNINTKESEFAPFKIGHRLYYTSSRERRIGVINLDRATQHQMLDLYYGDLKDSVTVINKKPLGNRVNTSLNQGAAFFDSKTSKLYYSGNVPADPHGERYRLAIFSSEMKEDEFQKPRIELLLPDTFSASHPMVYNNTLYFSSNLKGGKGKADLYSAELVEGKWANIRNLEQLNSPYDDYFPFVVNESEIYFSSNRPGGFGGLDLYKYTANANGSPAIANLGKPINSRADDYGAFIDAGQDKGYFTTNRNNNQDDIYHFRKTWPSFHNCLAAIKEKYCYDLTDEKSLDTDSLKGYFYEWDFGDGTKQKGISVTHCYMDPGNYVINLNIVDVSTKAVFLNQTSVDLTVDSIVQLKINALDTMLKNKKFTVNTMGTYLPGKKILGYYFEVDDKRLRTKSFEYSFPKPGKYQIKLGVEYEDRATKIRDLMCTTLDVTCVDSAAWLPFEQRKLDEVIAKFQARNIGAGKSGLNDMNFDAELAINSKLGLSRAKLADKIDDFLSAESEGISTKNLGNNKDGLSGMDEDAALAIKQKNQGKADPSVSKDDPNAKNLGNNKDGLSGMDEDAALAIKQRNKARADSLNTKDDPNAKNLGNNKDGLSGMDEDAALAIKQRNKARADSLSTKEDPNAKNLGNNKDGLSGMDEDAALAIKQRNKARVDSLNTKDDPNAKNLGNNKNGLAGMDEDAEMAARKKKEQQQAEEEGFGKNLGAQKQGMADLLEEAELTIRKNSATPNPYLAKNLRIKIDTLLNLNEDAELSFRVHLGRSKTRLDTTILNSKGMFGINEEVINEEYYYTYGSEKKVNSIEKYYRKAITAGIKEPVIIAYRNNAIVPNQHHQFKIANFGTPEKKLEKPQTVKEKIMALFKKPKPKEETVAVIEPAIEKPVAPAIAEVKKEAPGPQAAKKDSVVPVKETLVASVEPEVKQSTPPLNTEPPAKKPAKKETLILPTALKPEDIKIEDAHTPEGEVAMSAKISLAEFVEKYGDASAPDLQFRVQISAFKYRNRYEFPHLANLGAIENTLTEGGITRITIGGQFDTYRKAQEHNKKVIDAGQKDAFVTVFYKGKRVYIENLEKMGIFVTK